MKVPKRIGDLIKKCARHNAIANQSEKELNEWLTSKGFNIENDNWVDPFIDSVKLGNDPDYIINYLKSAKSNKEIK